MTRGGMRAIGILSLIVLSVSIFWAGSAKAFFPLRALRVLRILNFSAPTDLNPQIIKTTYSDPSRASQEMSFENGEKVYVKIEIFEPNSSGQKMKIRDRVFNGGSFAGFGYTASGSAPSGLTPAINEGGHEINFDIQTKQGINEIRYDYEAGD